MSPHQFACGHACVNGREQIIVCIYGPRGGTQHTCGLTLAAAVALRDDLTRALRAYAERGQ